MNSPGANIRNQKGDFGGVYIADTVVRNGTFDGYLALTATVIATLVSSNISGALTAVAVPAGTILQGHFTAITLTSGTGIAYNATP